MHRAALLLSALTLAACIAAPVSTPAAPRLDAASVAVAQAGLTAQAGETNAARTAEAALTFAASTATAQQWTVTAYARTEAAALTAEYVQAQISAATLAALTPTITRTPTNTPLPTRTPTPNALATERAATLQASQHWAGVVLPWVLIVAIGLAAAMGLLYLAGRLLADWERRMGEATRARMMPAGSGVWYDPARDAVVGLLTAPTTEPATPAQPDDDSLAYTADWQRGYWMFARWLEVLPREERTRQAMTGIVTAHGWNVYMEGLKRIEGALTRDGKAYRLAVTPDDVRRACADVIPPFNRSSPTVAPAVRAVDAQKPATVATVATATDPG